MATEPTINTDIAKQPIPRMTRNGVKHLSNFEISLHDIPVYYSLLLNVLSILFDFKFSLFSSFLNF